MQIKFAVFDRNGNKILGDFDTYYEMIIAFANASKNGLLKQDEVYQFRQFIV